MFALEKAQAEIDKRNAGVKAASDPNQGAMFSRGSQPFYSALTRDPFESKQSAVMASLKEPGTRAVQDDNGNWLLALRERPYTEQEKADAQQRVAALNRALLRYSVAPAEVLLDAPTPAMAWGRSVARTLGFEVTFIRNNRDFNGVAIGGRSFVGPSTEHPEIGLIGHELLHALKQTDPQAYQALAEQIRPYLKDGVVEAKRKWEDARGGKNTTVALAEEEVIADLNGSMWLDPKFWHEMARNDPN